MKIRTIIKILENNDLEYQSMPKEYSLKEFKPLPKDYKTIYHEIGKNYCWFMKLQQTDEEIQNHLNQTFVKNYQIFFKDIFIGFVELHFYDKGVYLQYFGLFDNYICQGHGNNSLKLVINHVKKFFINHMIITTNNLDHENAIKVYTKNGFVEKEEIEEVWELPDDFEITERNKKWII